MNAPLPAETVTDDELDELIMDAADTQNYWSKAQERQIALALRELRDWRTGQRHHV